ncbi:cell wall protein [Bacillus sp. AFS001701]|uniref:DUF916 and DUF3324 domain-containing protein n=3 Tax=Bacillaceae TaxID=186817 RepID=UPI000BF52A8C|nr:DUF916 and DUF3324 domain-containing protein [Bacillus sp. AFS001701]PET57003.1 cell wall protein [Bacillus sp. AFS001701]
MKKWFSILMAVFIGISFINLNSAYASSMNYSVKADIPENQMNDKVSYFDLKMTPAKSQIISLTVRNEENNPIELMIEPNTAITNQNGVIDYNRHNYKKDSSLKYAFSDIISKKQKVVLKGKETKRVFFTIQMPKKSFDGIILGGFYISKINNEQEIKKQSNVQVKNEFSYVIGVKLSETEAIVQPELKLNKVKADLLNYRTVVTANIQNTEATIINNLNIEATVTKEGQKKSLHKSKKENLSMAPNSNFDFPISWDQQELKPGKYHLYITAKDKNHVWEFDKMFEIKENDAELNKQAVELEKNNYLIYIGIALLFLIVIVLIFWFRKKKKEDDQS